MPNTQLRILQSRPIIILLQPTAITKLLALQFLPIIPILILRVLRLYCFVGDPRHGQPECIVVIFFYQRPTILPYAEIIKERIPSRGLIAYINIQISTFSYRNPTVAQGIKGIRGSYGYCPGLRVTAYIIELIIKQYPVQVCFG